MRIAMARLTRSRVVLAAAPLLAVGAWGIWQPARDEAIVGTVVRGDLTALVTTAGVLQPIQALTYRSPIAGRELEIVELAAEGTLVQAGDLLARLDTTELQRELERVGQERRQAAMDLQTAEHEQLEAEATLRAVSEGEGALTVEEAQLQQQLASRKVERLRLEVAQLQPLMDKGFITRHELARVADDLDRAERELALLTRRSEIVTSLSHPREAQRASLQLAQRNAQLENVRLRVEDTRSRASLLAEQIAACRVVARQPGLVVHEELMSSSPRRKVRVGDRVSSSQGLVTIPEVDRMVVAASVSEADVHRVRPGQLAVVRLESYPGVRLSGRVQRVGTMASAVAGRGLEDKRFELVIALDPASVELKPEMTTRADVVVGTRRGVILAPVNAVFDRDGVAVAHVVFPGRVETRPVELGESDDRVVEILAGLSEGERVRLADMGPDAPASGPIPAGGEHVDALQPR